LITGGLGGIGLTLARYLAETVQARLVLVGRGPAGEEGERAVAALEALGATVMVRAADIADRDRMEQLWAEAVARFDGIDGIVHCAGTAASGFIQSGARDEAVFRAKVEGTSVLADLAADAELDFWVLCSSILSEYGGPGQVDYCAANAFLDAFAQQRAGLGESVIAIGWSAWREVGMAARIAAHNRPGAPMVRRELTHFGLSPAEGVDLFSRILDADLPRVVVSPVDPAVRKADRAASRRGQIGSTGGQHARPQLTVPFEAPQSSLEREIATLWAEVLGLEKIGRHDNFFELGGDSLSASQLGFQLREHFDAPLPLADFYADPTPAGLAALIENIRWMAGPREVDDECETGEL
jgi:NAD(P)-dependent dehydrogenase (short-subunit alcohol dehydrogenase family)/acyl carrier protein